MTLADHLRNLAVELAASTSTARYDDYLEHLEHAADALACGSGDCGSCRECLKRLLEYQHLNRDGIWERMKQAESKLAETEAQLHAATQQIAALETQLGVK